MAKLLVTYHSKTGHTARMAELVAEGARATGTEVTLLPAADVDPKSLVDYDGIIAGAPTYYGLPSWPIKKLFDESVVLHKQLDGKVGGAFTSAANIGGGNETTVMGILQMMLIHGMVVQGNPKGDHYGPVAINTPDERASEQCRVLGRRVAELAARLHD